MPCPRSNPGWNDNPFLKAAVKSTEDCIQVTDEIIEMMKIAAFLTGSKTIQELQTPGKINRTIET